MHTILVTSGMIMKVCFRYDRTAICTLFTFITIIISSFFITMDISFEDSRSHIMSQAPLCL